MCALSPAQLPGRGCAATPHHPIAARGSQHHLSRTTQPVMVFRTLTVITVFWFPLWFSISF